MKTSTTNPTPAIIAHTRESGEVEMCNIRRTTHTIGCVLRGRLVVCDDRYHNYIGEGELFFLHSGTHTLIRESIDHHHYEDVTFQLTDQQLATTLREVCLSLGVGAQLTTPLTHFGCISQPSTPLLRHFFRLVRVYASRNLFERCGAMEEMKVKELLSLLLLNPSSPIVTALRTIAEGEGFDFEHHIYRSIFRHVPLHTLAEECSMSLSGFKSHFRRHFGESPHRWFVRERLAAARTLLLTTQDSVKTISRECGFATPSHLIHLFSQTFGTTPAHYREHASASPPRDRIEISPNINKTSHRY